MPTVVVVSFFEREGRLLKILATFLLVRFCFVSSCAIWAENERSEQWNNKTLCHGLFRFGRTIRSELRIIHNG